ncbi:cytochrome c/FTR1 family iron permease [Methylibium petroleiphilum]|uniref:Permease n=1 Tax=Methylibium petroleiphilum (strain ATCC BAA-1232 / LMG 22953 / PM1) TaxID=420662 RepID=A2SIC0_METPP|nr:cytochrome c/FTR1 family iron permease [Methylibium petroleiphilum]ABM95309.1 permease [Methylibium petroleiphilum PM1]
MPLLFAWHRLNLFILLVGWAALLPAHADLPQANPRQTWQMLDYIAVDYAGAVQGGRVVAPGEYAEMQEFAGAVRTQLAALPATPKQPALLAQAERLVAAVAAKAEPAQVATLARGLADDLLASYPIGAVPASPPEPARAAALYAQQCAACHGPTGHGDGPAAAGLDPPPIAFADAGRADQRTPLALYEVISQGVPGTSMASFAGLPENDRWALAFYVGSLAYSPQARADGEALWRQNGELRGRIPSLEALTRTREADLAAALPAAQAHAIVAYLRSRPQAVTEPVAGAGPFALARQRLAESERAYIAGDATQATTLALSAYLDGVEPVEPTLAARDVELLREIETTLARYRTQLGRRTAPADLATQKAQINALFDRAEAVLADTHLDTTTAFLGSFTILVREGLEALLIVIGMIAFLRKAERREVLPYVHAGWVGALLAGAATWAVATYLVDISGANREVTEGVSALFAAAVLLSVGIWMHQKSLAGRWQQYLHAKLSAALTRRSAMFLFVLAFVAVYREVFETILFYIAMWSEQASGAIVAGLLVGSVVLAAVAYWMLRVSRRLPIGQFFSISSILIAVLAVVLVGKGVAALQEAGWVPQALIAGPRVEWLGVYPSWQSLLAQLAVATAAVVGFLFNARAVPASARTRPSNS